MYHIGDILYGRVTGIQSYGVFIALDEEVQGLIHISELKHSYIKDIHNEVKVGQVIKVKIIDIDEYSHKISLSRRALDPKVPYRYNKHKFFTNKNKTIGFESLAENMDKFISECLKNLQHQDLTDSLL